MEESLHYLLMADHSLLQKSFFAGIRETELTPGQPKILDYLSDHDGVVQKEIAEGCYIEPATMTSVLLGMEKKGLVVRKNLNGNRRNLYVYLTDKGRTLAAKIRSKFGAIEEEALFGFDDDEREKLIDLLMRVNKNLQGGVRHEEN